MAGARETRRRLFLGARWDRLFSGRSILVECILAIGTLRRAALATRDGDQRMTVSRRPLPIEDEAAFERFIDAHFDPEDYLARYPDVAAAGMDPREHWMNHGVFEGRLPASDTETRVMPAVDANWRCFSWRGAFISARQSRMRDEVIEQIMRQSRHDPALLAAGARAIAGLRVFNARDLLDRDGVDVRSVFEAIGEPVRRVIILPMLVIGGAEKYAADIARAFAAMDGEGVLALVTDQTREEAGNWANLAILEPLRSARVVFWRDACGGFGHTNPTVLARLMNALRPETIIVVNSRVGLDMVARFGRGLANRSRLFCAYFGLGVNALGAPYGARFPRRTHPYAITLTDNEATAATLDNRHGKLPGPGMAVLPPAIAPAADAVFARRLAALRTRLADPSRPRRWLWISRVEPYKGVAILAALARARPADCFDIFGPVQRDPASLGLDLSNVRICQPLDDVAGADFAAYDGFLFTSLFEGMPNVVLEMAQHALPMALSRVGGLPWTFDETSARFVDVAEHGAAVAGFMSALDGIRGLGPNDATAMVENARARSLARHAPTAYTAAFERIFGSI
jgi:glycosyltransferase involved in cell wall biosynthesis